MSVMVYHTKQEEIQWLFLNKIAFPVFH